MIGFVLVLAPTLLTAQAELPRHGKPPLEAHATLDGQDALSGNVGTLGFQSGFGLSYRHLGPPRDGNTDTVLAAWSPLPLLTIGAGVEYARFGGGVDFVQSSIGFALRPTLGLSVALAYKPLFGAGALVGTQMHSWDLGVGLRPARWLSLTAAVEQFNQPVSNGWFLPRTWAVGAGFRPFRNDLLTVGADVRMRETSALSLWPAPRFTLDFRPTGWMGLLLSATTTGDFFAGVTVRENRVDAGVGFGANASGFQSSYAFARFSSQAREGLDFSGKKTVQLALSGNLRPGDAWSWLRMAKPQFGEVPLQLRALAERDDVVAVRLVFQGFDCSFATLRDVRDAILELRRRGKRVVAELGQADDRDLFVASAADEIVMEPSASLQFNGVKVALRGFKRALDMLGVKVQAQASGDYKNAPDAFTKDEPSSQQIEVQQSLLDNLYDGLVTAVAEGRSLPRSTVEALLERGLFSAAQAKAAGLIDTLSYDPTPNAPLPRSRYTNLVNARDVERQRDEWNGPPAIGLVQIEGSIMGGDSFEDPFGIFPIAGSGSIVRALEEARVDPNVKAIVVRINSPGGDILASDFIWQAMRRARLTKPLVVSMGDVAASGGYYAALPAHVIFAQPETMTGSIGVFNFKIDLSGLLDKLGVSNVVLKRGARADMFDLTRPLTADEQATMQAHVQDLYESFLDKVMAGRRFDHAKAHALGQGRVWTGRQALSNGLVDRLGGLTDAIAEAKRLAGYTDAAVVDVQPVPGLGSPLNQFVAQVQALVGTATGPDATSWVAVAQHVQRIHAFMSDSMLYMLPFSIGEAE